AGHEAVEHIDRPKCHPETRLTVINDIMSWVDSTDPKEKIMWMNGPAGAGKSSIAQTIAQRCQQAGKPISSFFFSREAGNGRDDGNRVVPTMAYQLMLAFPSIQEFIIAELDRDPALLTYLPMEAQIQKLIMQPLSNTGNCNFTTSFLVIIDGLDECRRPDIQARIIKMLASVLSKADGVYLRCFITSRPELEIRNTFNNHIISDISVHVVLDDKYNADQDIRTYLLSEFATIKFLHTPAFLYLIKDSNWPTAHDIDILVWRSSGQFIYASTVVKF
ncbi:hypothetical protein BDQ17DRAFT_1499497, partial [Cyathus striatus]